MRTGRDTGNGASGADPGRIRRTGGAAAVIVLGLLVAALVRLYSGAVERQYPLSGIERFVIDLNEAPAPTLEILPGVGPVLAGRIVAERVRGGPFADLADLDRRVVGVGPGICQRLEGLVRFGSPERAKESLADGAEPGSVR